MNLRNRIERLEKAAQSNFGYENLTLSQLLRLLFLHNKSRDLQSLDLLTDAELEELCNILDICRPEKATTETWQINLKDLSDEELDQYILSIDSNRRRYHKDLIKSREELESEIQRRYVSS